MAEVCRSRASANPFDLLERVFTTLEIFTREGQQDDLTAAVFHYCPR